MDWREAESIFQEVVASSAGERDAILARRCGDDASLRAFVERLLNHDDSGMGDFLRPLGPTAGLAQPEEAPIPERIGQYEILGLVGKGGMGTVYEARDSKLGRRIALKVLPMEVAGDSDRLLRFEREARAVAALNHPNIVTLHTVEHADDLHFLTMELVGGGALTDVIPPGGFTLERFLDLAIPLADGMIYAHDRDIVHRDLKPGNVVLDDQGRPKILDFSLAKFLGGPDRDAAIAGAEDAVTAEGFVFGTVSYMSPEQLQGKEVDHRADIYSLGAVLFEMATGRRPFTGESLADIASSVLRDPAPSLGELRDDLPATLNRIVRRCLEKDPQRRYQSALELRDDLTTLRRRVETGEVEAMVHAARKRSWRLRIAAGVLVVAALITVYASLDTRRRPGTGNEATETTVAPEVRPRLVVLPFENLGEAADDYIAAGITQEIMSRLVEVGELSVVSRTSSARYAHTEKSVLEIGEELGVSYILEGTVHVDRLADGTSAVRVTPELIDVPRDTQLWTGRYSASLAPGEIFMVQSSIAEEVATAMNVTLAAEERQAIRYAPTVSAPAYDSYLLGRFHWHKRTARSLELAAEYFEAAIASDEDFSAAWAGLADTYVLFPLYGIHVLTRADAYERAERAARRAIELDGTLSAAHTSLAVTLFFGRWEFEAAEPHFRRSVELDPDYAVGHYWYGELLAATGRLDQAVAHARKAVSADPSLAVAHHLLGVWLIASGDAGDGEAQLHFATELEPDFPFARVELADFYFRSGKLDDAFLQWARSGIPEELTTLVAEASRNPAMQDSARVAIGRFENSPDVPGHFGNLGAASFYALIGDNDTAMRRLEASFRERSEAVTFLPTMAVTDPGIALLAEDARFQGLLGRIGLK